LGEPKIAKAMLDGGISQLADSHIESLEKLKPLNKPLMLLRQGQKKDISKIVEIADISLISTLIAAQWLSCEAVRQNKTHQLILMLETGDRREGFSFSRIIGSAMQIIKLPNIKIAGIGTNVACLKQSYPNKKNLDLLIKKAEEIKKLADIKIISGGNSSAWPLLKDKKLPKEINQLRIGEAILLGNDTVKYQPINGAYQNCFRLEAEVIEAYKKVHDQAVLAVGLQDIGSGVLTPIIKDLEVKRVSSDHLVLKTNNVQLRVGDRVSFVPTYFALLGLMTSPFVQKAFHLC